MTTIYECKVSDGIRQYFESASEAEFFANDTSKAGFLVRTQAINLPTTAKEFVGFMERQFEDLRELLLALRHYQKRERP